MKRMLIVMVLGIGMSIFGEEFSLGGCYDGLRMDDLGWEVMYVHNGGFGRFPTSYSYVVAELNGQKSLVDTYWAAQWHGNGNAIPVDWDGNKADGVTALLESGVKRVVLGVRVHCQGVFRNGQAGCAEVDWSFGPGKWTFGSKELLKEEELDLGSGPRLGYKLNYQKGKGIQFRLLSPGTSTVSKSSELSVAPSWFRLELALELDRGLRQVRCIGRALDEGGEELARLEDVFGFDACKIKEWNALRLDTHHTMYWGDAHSNASAAQRDGYDKLSVTLEGEGVGDDVFLFRRPLRGASLGLGPTLFLGDSREVGWKLFAAEGVAGTRVELSFSIKNRLYERFFSAGEVSLVGGESRSGTLLVSDLHAGSYDVIGTHCGEQVYAGKLTVLGQTLPKHGENVLRNGSFEYDDVWNGSHMRKGGETYQGFALVSGTKNLEYRQTGAEGWWAIGDSAEGCQLLPGGRSGSRYLRIRGDRSVISAWDPVLPAGDVTLSAWVRCRNVKGKLALSCTGLTGWKGAQVAEVRLPEDCDWTQVKTLFPLKDLRRVAALIQVSSGEVDVDDVQLCLGDCSESFSSIRGEAFELGVVGFDAKDLPKWRVGTGDQVLRVGRGLYPLDTDSRIKVWMGAWDRPRTRLLAEVSVKSLPFEVPLPISELAAGSYVVSVESEALDSLLYFRPFIPVGGVVSETMSGCRGNYRFALAPKMAPHELFGVGNGMIGNGFYWGGHEKDDYLLGAANGFTSTRGPYSSDIGYLVAMGGLFHHASISAIDSAQGSPHVNPADPGKLDVFHPDGWKTLVSRGEELGRQLGKDPTVATLQMANEHPYVGVQGTTPSIWADDDFRQWCRLVHKDLDVLNGRWGTSYSAWSQVEQPISAKFIELAKSQPVKTGAAAIDWTASTGQFNDAIVKRLKDCPGQAMDWLRWRTHTSLRVYDAFREAARKHDTKTLYSTNLCWPNFWPQMFMPFVRRMDVTMLDCQYTSGFRASLGNPAEMMDILQMAESVDPSKPMWGIEIYVQPSWPEAFVAMQNWALLAHGMDNNLVFGWRPYSDRGIPKTVRFWEANPDWPMWFIIDLDGTKLPHYYENQRSVDEINRFHKRFDGRTLRRKSTDVALYVSKDTSENIILATGNKPWLSKFQNARENLSYVMRLQGVTADYVDDETLPDTVGKFKYLVVPASDVISDESAKRIASFARSGGTVVFAGASGFYDIWLREQRFCLGGEAWSELGWKASMSSGRELSGGMYGYDDIGMSGAEAVRDETG